MATADDKAVLLAQLMEIMGTSDDIQARCLLEASGYDLDICLAMLSESQAATRRLSACKITVVFDEDRFELQLPGSTNVTALKEEIEKSTNIVPAQQMLVEQSTQMEVTQPTSTIADILDAVGASELRLHLLTPNSSA
eukprot:m.9057 g.9057  ORF g.9057 m.9057 type:complete len:138 (+) comp2358_c0_seq2:53-466(+)